MFLESCLAAWIKSFLNVLIFGPIITLLEIYPKEILRDIWSKVYEQGHAFLLIKIKPCKNTNIWNWECSKKIQDKQLL